MTKEEMVKRWGENYDPANAIVEQDKYLFGMCYIAPSRDVNAPNNYVDTYQLLANMGVKSLRHWMHFRDLLKDPNTLREDRVAYQHELLAEAKKYGFQIIGMNHTNYIDGGFVGPKHKYQPWEGSDYYAWLEDYEQCWYTLVKEFPEVTYWEIENEVNNPGFMEIYGNVGGYKDPEVMLAQTLDMMFYASRGIHRANPNAITVMSSLTEPAGIGNAMSKTYEGVGKVVYPTNAEFLEMMYQAILSGEHGSRFPDDFFQVASWHPYYWKSTAADQYWINENNELYNIILKYEGKDKKVFLTEMGWGVKVRSEEEVAKRIGELYATVAEHLPYVESVHYFRLFEDYGESNSMYGLFTDPRMDEPYAGFDEILRAPGEPRLTAYAYQKAAGASGSLTFIMEKLQKNK